MHLNQNRFLPILATAAAILAVGGTAAAPGPDTVLLGLATGALVLMVTGGGMLRAARRPRA